MRRWHRGRIRRGVWCDGCRSRVLFRRERNRVDSRNEIDVLKIQLTNTHEENATLRRRIEELERRIDELEYLII